jgi:hypothetical protein
MPANGRWDLIRRLKVNDEVLVSGLAGIAGDEQYTTIIFSAQTLSPVCNSVIV